MKPELRYLDPSGTTAENEKIEGCKIGTWTKRALQNKQCEGVREQRWQGMLHTARWDDKDLDGDSFEWMSDWKTAPTHTIAGISELYEQLLPTKLFNARKTKSSEESDVRCRMYGKAQESIAHVLSSCSALAQTEYLSRHNGALKILFFELLKDYQLIEAVPPWNSSTQPKPLYQNDQVTAYWDVPVYTDHTEVRANRVDARIVDKERKTVTLLEMSCPLIENRKQKDEENRKYASLRWEIKKQYPGYKITQINIIMDVLGGFSKGLSSNLREILGAKCSRGVLGRMQKSVLSSSLNVVRTFKVLC